MAKDFAKQFYNSAVWIRTSKAYAASKFFLCEKCGEPARRYIVHHKKHLTPDNINDPAIALDWNNLQLLCTECHNKVHRRKSDCRKVYFDAAGQVIGIEPPPVSVLKD